MYCKNCGVKLMENVSFCTECGTKFEQDSESAKESSPLPKTPSQDMSFYISKLRPAHYFLASFITSLVGTIILLSSDFAGWYYRGEYSFSWLSGGIVDFITISIIAGLLLYTVYVSCRSLLLSLSGTLVPRRSLRFAFYAAIGSFFVCFIAGMMFLLVNSYTEPDDWWLDTGFTCGLIFAGLTALFIGLGMRSTR